MPTLKIAGTISFPLADEATLPSRPYSAELDYTQKNTSDVVIVGIVADQDLLGGISDVKAAYIEVVSGAGDLKINAAATVLSIDSSGGFWIYFNPNGGLSALTVTTTANATFRVYLFS